MVSRVFPVLSVVFMLFTCFAGDDLDTQLVEAVKAGDIKQVETLVTEGADVNFKLHDTYGSPLGYALDNKNYPVAEHLISHGADVDERNDLDQTFLIRACMIGNRKMAAFLIKHGASLNARAQNGDTPLCNASYAMNSNELDERFIDVVRLLLEKGVDVSLANDRGYAPIHYAATQSRFPIIDILLEHGADINGRANDGRTPLYYAIVDPNPELLRFLLDRGADPNIVMHNRQHDGMSYLQIAREVGNKEIIQLLESAGALESVQDTRD